MRVEQQSLGEDRGDRRSRRLFGIVLAAACGLSVIGLATWLLVAAVPKRGHSVPNQPQAVPLQIAAPANRAAEPLVDFVSAILGDTEDVWREQFRAMKRTYEKPHLVLFSGQIRSACGIVRSTVGPSYCPLDQKIYIDLSFFKELEERYHATGDFARAYVIAHEVGHHVQKLLGILEKERAGQPELGKDPKEQSWIRLELQADFFAGVWAHRAHKARHILEPGDVEAALRLLTAIGDDHLPLDGHGDMDTRSMTRCWDRRHGTAQQKVRWFRRGLETGDLSQGKTIDGT
jgi:predicted metalloprotease